jgi:FdhD protein
MPNSVMLTRYHTALPRAMARADSISPAVRSLRVARHGHAEAGSDLVAVETPLDVRLNGDPFAVIMRTPGADPALALGLLHAEGLVRNASDVIRVEEPAEDVVNVVFGRGRADAVAAALAARRLVTVSASCGVCGRRDLSGLDGIARIEDAWCVPAAVVDAMPAMLRGAQSAFAQTGGLHAAGLFGLDGRLEGIAEDVGRHNAVDKLVGMAVRDGRLPLRRRMLLVSGRTSFEIVQKAWRARLALLAAVSAPSSMAVDVADQAGITLLGFVRDDRFNIYTHPERVAL